MISGFTKTREQFTNLLFTGFLATLLLSFGVCSLISGWRYKPDGYYDFYLKAYLFSAIGLFIVSLMLLVLRSRRGAIGILISLIMLFLFPIFTSTLVE
jgi:hypothetical protein